MNSNELSCHVFVFELIDGLQALEKLVTLNLAGNNIQRYCQWLKCKM